MATCVIPSCWSHPRNASNSTTVVPNLRCSTRGSPGKGPTMMHTAKNFLPTSMPAHLSISALIIVLFPSGTEEQMTSIGITSSSARLLHSGVLHVILASFSIGTHYTAINDFSRPLQPANILKRCGAADAHFHLHGWPVQPAISVFQRLIDGFSCRFSRHDQRRRRPDGWACIPRCALPTKAT